MCSAKKPRDPAAPPPPPEPAKAPAQTEVLATQAMLRRRQGGLLGTIATSPLGLAQQTTGEYKSMLGN
jgi:hypothetical protein